MLENIKIGDYYNLKGNHKQIVSKKEENGYSNQYFEREEIRWIVLDKNEETGEILLISERPTAQEITLKRQRRIC